MGGQIVVDPKVLNDIEFEIKRYAEKKLETGGVFLGCYDELRNIFYLMENISGGEAAVHKSNSFVLDDKYLTKEANERAESYAIDLELMGVWHTHYAAPAIFSGPDEEVNNRFYKNVSRPVVSMIAKIDGDEIEYHFFMVLENPLTSKPEATKCELVILDYL